MTTAFRVFYRDQRVSSFLNETSCGAHTLPGIDICENRGKLYYHCRFVSRSPSAKSPKRNRRPETEGTDMENLENNERPDLV